MPHHSRADAYPRARSLELFVHQETGLDQEAVLTYLSDGRRLLNSNILDLAGAADQVRDLATRQSEPDVPPISADYICIQQILP